MLSLHFFGSVVVSLVTHPGSRPIFLQHKLSDEMNYAEMELEEPETLDDITPVDYNGNFAPHLINKHVYAENEPLQEFLEWDKKEFPEQYDENAFFDSLMDDNGNLPPDNPWDNTLASEY